MVSAPHEAMHRIFQQDPGLFSRVSRILGLTIPAPVAVTVLPTDLTETSPIERRVDTLLRLQTAEHGAFLLAVEAQGKKDPDKPANWAYYTSFLWTKYRLPTALLVVCQDSATAEWAQGPVASGPPQLPTLTLRPSVVGPHNMPVITDLDEARQDLGLATLSAITHASSPDIDAILKTLSAALRDAPQDLSFILSELTAQGLGKRPASHLWRNLMAADLSFFKSPISEEIRDEGRAKGRAEDTLRLLERRGVEVPDEARERITTCDDLDTLSRWFDLAITATTIEEVFADA
ncbi:hypothetical protein [Streptomyces sp. CBMA152]|uniref:hypothetical protein n=1 Tax=Streptomyces sp. CBMA152 TaxID=1896312 RepID=UPI00166110A8|nr:hypothetical protein [Streptomyces sp. CBMA152]MBD0745616.1 hypothetical protein [Streptomyces sp. CBMA152]